MKVSTGVPFLDRLLQGGFEEGSSIVAAGPPGTGKTTFSMAFLSTLKDGEKGMRVSFNEDSKSFLQFSKSIGYDCDELYKEGRVELVDMFPSKKELFEESVKFVFNLLEEKNITKLVIDSFTAMTQYMDSQAEVRDFLRNIMGDVVKRKGITSLLIVESPIGTPGLGAGIEEFAADGVLIFDKRIVDGRLLRELRIEKMRGAAIEYPKWFFTLKGGFKILHRSLGKPHERGGFKLPRVEKEYYTSGIETLDKIAGGGFKRRSIVLIERDPNVSETDISPILHSQMISFLKRGYMVYILHSPMSVMEEYAKIKKPIYRFVKRERVDANLKIVPPRYEEKVEEIELFRNLSQDPDVHYLWVVDWDVAEQVYGYKTLSKALISAFMERSTDNFLVVLIVTSTNPNLGRLSALASYHFKIKNIEGTPFLYGIKPYTKFYHISSEKRVPQVDLVEVI